MSTQADFWQIPPDGRSAAQARDAGMVTALDHADAVHGDWRGQARTALHAFRSRVGAADFQCEQLQEFAENVCGVPPPPSPTAWGGIVRGAANGPKALLEHRGTRNTRRPSGHAHPAAVWRFRETPA